MKSVLETVASIQTKIQILDNLKLFNFESEQSNGHLFLKAKQHKYEDILRYLGDYNQKQSSFQTTAQDIPRKQQHGLLSIDLYSIHQNYSDKIKKKLAKG